VVHSLRRLPVTRRPALRIARMNGHGSANGNGHPDSSERISPVPDARIDVPASKSSQPATQKEEDEASGRLVG
jgi:hypothetical protein